MGIRNVSGHGEFDDVRSLGRFEVTKFIAADNMAPLAIPLARSQGPADHGRDQQLRAARRGPGRQQAPRQVLASAAALVLEPGLPSPLVPGSERSADLVGQPVEIRRQFSRRSLTGKPSGGLREPGRIDPLKLTQRAGALSHECPRFTGGFARTRAQQLGLDLAEPLVNVRRDDHDDIVGLIGPAPSGSL